MLEKIEIIDPVKDVRWDQFVVNHPLGWLCHLSGWKLVLERSFPHMKGYYLALTGEENQIKAALPLYEVRSWLTGNRLVSIPFATLFDPLITSADEMDKLFVRAISLSQELKTKYIEIRTHKSSELILDQRLGTKKFFKHHYLKLDVVPDQLMKSFDRSCVRQRIQRALKNNLKLAVVKSEPALQIFYQLYLKSRKHLSLPPQPYRFIRELWMQFSPFNKIEVLLVELNGQYIGGAILFKFRDRVSIEYAVHDEEFRDVSPIHYLFWQTIKSSYDGGFKIFDLGRTSHTNTGLMDFKKRWGTEVVDLPQFYYPKQFSDKMENGSESIGYEVVKKICGIAPDAVLTALGNFCYRHLG